MSLPEPHPLLRWLGLDQPSARQRARWYTLLHRQLRAGLDLRSALPMLPAAAGMQRWLPHAQACVAAMDAGKPFEQALAAAPALFTPLDRAQLSAAQVAGKLEGAAERLAAVWQAEDEWQVERKKVLSYPIFLMVSACLLDPAVDLVLQGVGVWLVKALRNLLLLGALLLAVRVGLERLRQLLVQADLPWLSAYVRADQKARVLSVLADATDAGVPATTALPLAAEAAAVAQPPTATKLMQTLRDHGWGAAIHAIVPLRGDETAALGVAQTTGALPATLRDLARDALALARARELLLLKGLRFAAMALAIGIAVLQMVHGLETAMNPMAALESLDAPEGRELRRELERSAPELLKELK